METKRDFETKAKALISSDPDEAVKLYHEIWETFNDQFNDWDALPNNNLCFKVMRCLRGESLQCPKNQ